MYHRTIQDILEKYLGKKEIIILYGARQVGKTTLLHQLANQTPDSKILNCELSFVADTLESKDLSRIKALFEENKTIMLDEAQKILNIGSVLKLIYDELPQYQIIATGSSSFELANQIVEPLTGRNFKFKMFPLSIPEIKAKKGWLWLNQNLNDFLVYGSYPGIIDLPASEKTHKLYELSSDYLFQDILAYDNIKNPSLIKKLLKAIALQIGSQVSVNELANLLGIARMTVEKYLDLLEKNFVIISVTSLSTNLRNEIKKSKKYYFHDLGIRNAIINNFSQPESRNDMGALWENFCIIERIKWLNINQPFTNIYFWRTYDGAEIDLVEELNDNYRLFEFKWGREKRKKVPGSFSKAYKTDTMTIVTPENMHDLLDFQKG
jgi:uncharacterized protein